MACFYSREVMKLIRNGNPEILTGDSAGTRRILSANDSFELNHVDFVTRPNLMIFAVRAIDDIREISMDDTWRTPPLSL